MNKIFILLIWITNVSTLSAQTSLDSLVFKKINQYRTSLRLTELNWSDTIYNGAKHHTDYLYSYNRKNNFSDKIMTGHDEDVSLSDIEKESFETRAYKYHFDEECVTMFFGNIAMKDEVLANWIVKSWQGSSPHNKILTDPQSKSGAVSCRTLLISDVSEEDKRDNLKYGRDDKGIIYLSSTFNCKK
jgi:uncharacterized protein YkwD